MPDLCGHTVSKQDSSNYVYKYPIDIVGLLYLDSSLHDFHNPLLANVLLSSLHIHLIVFTHHLLHPKQL